MRLLQASGFGPRYLKYFNDNNPTLMHASYIDRKVALLEDRYDASHILQPVYENDYDTFFTISDDPILQEAWARENGLNSSSLKEILLAQIEMFKPDVIYMLDSSLATKIIKHLPECVKHTITWLAAPSGTLDLSGYDLVVSNFATLNEKWRSKGWNTGVLYPSWDPEIERLSTNLVDRPVDIFFTGSYTRTTGHDGRLELLSTVADMKKDYKVDVRLAYKKWGRLKDTVPLRWIPYPTSIPKTILETLGEPVFGRNMYSALSSSKIVLNPATSIAGDIRGNMRCWEALGSGACMLATPGKYPEGFEEGTNFETFTSPSDLRNKITSLLADESWRVSIAIEGQKMVKSVWSKSRQWSDFQLLVGNL